MSGILRLENLNKGTTLKQGDKTVLSYRLSDADGEQLNIAGKPAVARLMHPDFTRIGYESEALTVSADNIVQFSIESIIPSRLYYLEITVDGQYIFPSRSDEGKLSIDRSSMGAEITIIENAGIDAVVRKAVDLINEDPSLIIDEDKLISEIIANTSVGSIEEYYQEYRDAIKEYADLKPKALTAISKSDDALTKSQNALNVANGIDAKTTNALSLSESADTLSKSVQEQFNQVVIDGDSSVEAAQARVDASGQTNPTLKARLDKEYNEVSTQLAQKGIHVTDFGALADGVTDDSVAVQSAIDSLSQGGTLVFPPNKTLVVNSLRGKSNITIDLNGSTLKQKDNVPIYNNVIDVGGNGIVRNFKITNGKIDGNKENQTVEFYRYGIYTLDCDGVIMEDLEIFNFTGEGIFLGYTGYYSKNIYINRVFLHGNLRNDLAITNAENVYIDDLVVDSIAYDSASVDLELQHDTDNIINVHFRNLFVKSSTQQAKIVRNGFDGILKNITINNAVFTGAKSLGIEDADVVTLNNIQAEQGIEIIGCRDVLIDGMRIKGSTKSGLYIYKNAINGNVSRNIALNNVDVSYSSSYGVLLQDVDVASLSNVRSYNNNGNGIGILYNNKNIRLSNVSTTDTREIGKTQPYGVEFAGVNTDIYLSQVSVDGNATGGYLELPSDAKITAKDRILFENEAGTMSTPLTYGEEDYTLGFNGFMSVRRFKLTGKYAQGYDILPNGSIYEDTYAGNLRYKTQSGSVQEVSDRKMSAPPTNSTYYVGDKVYNSAPASGSYIGWVCVAGGTPGTWKGFGLIE